MSDTERDCIKVEFTHQIEGFKDRHSLRGCLHIIEETIIVDANDFEEQYIFIPMWCEEAGTMGMDRAIAIKHVVDSQSHMVDMNSNLASNLKIWLMTKDSKLLDALIPLLRKHYSPFLTDMGLDEDEIDETFNL